MPIRSTGCVLSALLLCGCVSAPTTKPQMTEMPQQALGLGADPAPSSDQAWWKAFGDPQVDRLADRLMQSNPTLQGVLARIRAAQADISINRAANYPQVNLDASVQRMLLSDAYIFPAGFGGTSLWAGDVQARMSWSLDFWGKQAALIDRARGTAAAVALDGQAARLALAGTFAQAYVGLFLAWQNVDIADQAVRERQTMLDLTQSRVTAGLENEAALEQAKALLAMSRIEVMKFQAQRDVAVHAIAALTGQGADAYAAIERPVAALDTALPLPAALPADLLARRPDILAARARVTAAMRGRDAAHADFFPNINLNANIGLQAVGLGNIFTNDAFTAGAGPAIHLPVFDAGKIRAQYARATADLDLAVSDYNATVLGAVRQVSDALTQVKSLEGQRVQQQLALDSANRAFALAEERYRLGLDGQLPMLTAQNTLLAARQQMAALVSLAVIQRVTLLLSVGGGFAPPAQSATQDSNP